MASDYEMPSLTNVFNTKSELYSIFREDNSTNMASNHEIPSLTNILDMESGLCNMDKNSIKMSSDHEVPTLTNVFDMDLEHSNIHNADTDFVNTVFDDEMPTLSNAFVMESGDSYIYNKDKHSASQREEILDLETNIRSLIDNKYKTSDYHYKEVLDMETNARYNLSTNDVFHFLNLERVKKIGHGATGDILLVKSNGKHLAAKMFVLDGLGTNKKAATLKTFHQETSTMLSLEHSNIVQMGLPVMGPGYGVILMEYYQEGSLYQCLDDLIDRRVGKYFVQILSAVAYMHSKRSVHRDIKLNNVLCKNGDVYLTDFGLSKQLPEGDNYVSGNVGTSAFMAPEVIKSTPPNCEFYNGFKADAFAMGVFLWCLMMRFEPFSNNECWITLQKKVESGSVNDDILVECARQLLIGDVKDRTGVIELMEGLKENGYLSELMEF